MAQWQIIEGDCREVLRWLPARSVHTCVTSPPYFGLRDYGTGEWEGGDSECDHIRPKTTYNDGFNARWGNAEGQRKQETKNEAQFSGTCGKCDARRVDRQIGLEPTPDDFVAALVEVFREVRRVLRDDGTVWLNLGDAYCSGGKDRLGGGSVAGTDGGFASWGKRAQPQRIRPSGDVKQKDLLGIPWMVAFALRADGWYLRSDIIWAKPNPMPESVTDRPTKAHEYLFLLSKGPRYFYDAEAISEDSMHAGQTVTLGAKSLSKGQATGSGITYEQAGGNAMADSVVVAATRNKRSIWTVATQPYPGAHFATFPPKLIEPCILAGCPECGIVLDPFAGAGTTGVVALRHNRDFIGIELNAEYAELARWRIRDDAPLLNQAEVV